MSILLKANAILVTAAVALFFSVVLGVDCNRLPIKKVKPATLQSAGKLEISRALYALVTVASIPTVVEAAELAPPILGVDKNGLLKNCPDAPFSGCVSSQDDRPICFLAPWSYDGTWTYARRKLINYLRSRNDVRFLTGASPRDLSTTNDEFDSDDDVNDSGRYIRVEFVDRNTAVVDDTEFYFTPGDCTIQYRSLRRDGVDLLNQNRNRIEAIRIALGFENIPVGVIMLRPIFLMYLEFSNHLIIS
jgi:uncharacterized protein (DUF1499 family)